MIERLPNALYFFNPWEWSTRGGWFDLACSCLLPLYLLASAAIIVRKPLLGDILAIGLARAELMLGLLIVTQMHIFSYFCLCAYPFEPRMWLVNMCYAAAAFIVHATLVALCVAGVLLRYKTKLILSPFDIIGIGSAVLSVVMNMMIGGVLHALARTRVY